MTSAAPTSRTVDTARDYYDSDDADRYYATIWGGEDIHVGIYESPDESIFDASRRTVELLASTVGPIGTSTGVLDLGSGYGGAARYLAGTFGCHVTALNLSAVENRRARVLNEAAGLERLIEVLDGSFESVPKADASFDLVWSQDAILHSGDRDRVIAEVARVLRPGGSFIFTDPMQSDDCPAGVLAPILDRIHLETLGSPGYYRDAAARHGLELVQFDDLTDQLTTHYGRVLEETEARQSELRATVSTEYIARMKRGLRHWIDGGSAGHLAWGISHFRKK